MAHAALIVTKKGKGKIVNAEDYQTHRRGSRGSRTFKRFDDDDAIAAVEHVQTGQGQRVLIVTAKGIALMTEVDEIAARSLQAGGIKLIQVDDGDEVVAAVV